MPTGNCLCGKTTVEVQGEPQLKALCHCTDCQRTSGSTNSVNLVFGDDGLKWTGQQPKQYEKKSDAGRSIISHFCADCGSTIGRTGDAFPNQIIIKAGCLDGGLESAKPSVELFTKSRVSWVPEASGAKQVDAMPS